tara:strand:+ start:1342 stop:2721 length:1380 start_codon:yes stop_codon:yes gene_type:complete
VKKFLCFLIICFTVGCSQDSEQPSKTTPSSKWEYEEVASNPLSPNGSWSLQAGAFSIEGDSVLWSQSSSWNSEDPENPYTADHFNLGNSNDTGITGSIISNPLVERGTSGTSNVVFFKVVDEFGTTFKAEGEVTIDISWDGDFFLSVTAEGDSIIKIDGEGNVEDLGDFFFQSEIELSSELSGSSETVEDEDEFECPEWSTEEIVGVMPPQLAQAGYSQRSEPANLWGDIAGAFFDPTNPNDLLLKLQTTDSENHAYYGAEIFVEGIPPEGYVGVWPNDVKAMSLRVDQNTSWVIDPSVVSLEVISWNEKGAMEGKVTVSTSIYQQYGTFAVPYLEQGASITLDFLAPHPIYQDSYAEICGKKMHEFHVQCPKDLNNRPGDTCPEYVCGWAIRNSKAKAKTEAKSQCNKGIGDWNTDHNTKCRLKHFKDDKSFTHGKNKSEDQDYYIPANDGRCTPMKH